MTEFYYYRQAVIFEREIISSRLLIFNVAIIALGWIIKDWWLGLLITPIPSFLYFLEYWPQISAKRASKIIHSTRVMSLDQGWLPLSAHIVRTLARKNRELHRRRKTHRWHIVQGDVKKQLDRRFAITINEDCFFLLCRSAYQDDYYDRELIVAKNNKNKEE